MSQNDKLSKYQAINRERTVFAVETAKREIEAELAEHSFYPHNNGRITRREVCKRAGIGESTLKNARHRATADKLERWLARLKGQALTTKPAADTAKQARITELRQQLVRIAQHYNLYVLEHNDLLRRYETLEAENIDLKRQVAELLADGQKIIPLRRPP